MAIDWLHGKKIQVFGSKQTLVVFLYKKGEKQAYKIFHGIGKITLYEKIDESKHGCKICGKPFDRKANLIRHREKHHNNRGRKK